jgi:DNA polymerase-3 subunit alpha
MVDVFINRKHGRERVSFPHPALEPVLRDTYGVIVYQEQVMQISQVLGGYSLGRADLLRRAMGKKKAEVMAAERQGFLEGCQKTGADPRIAGEIFDLMEKFAEYGFNKSHSAAYGLITIQTAWLKAHYPVEFMAALLTSEKDNTDKVVAHIAEARGQGYEVLPPDVNVSHLAFGAVEGKIRFGLGAIKGVGESAIEAILEARKAGPFRDLFDFSERVDSRRVNRKVIEALVKAGAFDFEGGRAASCSSPSRRRWSGCLGAAGPRGGPVLALRVAGGRGAAASVVRPEYARSRSGRRRSGWRWRRRPSASRVRPPAPPVRPGAAALRPPGGLGAARPADDLVTVAGIVPRCASGRPRPASAWPG